MKAPAGPKGGAHELQEGLTHTSTAPAAAGAAAARVYRPHPKGFTTEGTTAGSDRGAPIATIMMTAGTHACTVSIVIACVHSRRGTQFTREYSNP